MSHNEVEKRHQKAAFLVAGVLFLVAIVFVNMGYYLKTRDSAIAETVFVAGISVEFALALTFFLLLSLTVMTGLSAPKLVEPEVNQKMLEGKERSTGFLLASILGHFGLICNHAAVGGWTQYGPNGIDPVFALAAILSYILLIVLMGNMVWEAVQAGLSVSTVKNSNSDQIDVP